MEQLRPSVVNTVPWVVEGLAAFLEALALLFADVCAPVRVSGSGLSSTPARAPRNEW